MKPPLSRELQLLLRALSAPLDTDITTWERLLRLARMTALHGRLAAANRDNPTLPAPVRRHLLSAERVCAFNNQMLRAELTELAALCDGSFPVLVVKGGAYALQGQRFARGRFVSDVDLLVPRDHLRAMEQGLRAAGWVPAQLDPYDERYYRDWSHETPPMRFPGRFLEVDLHHAITPVTGSLHFDPAPLFDASVPLADYPFRVLSAEDQVLHACVHRFQDGDLALRVREVVDIDGLVRAAATQDGFWKRLLERAGQLGLQRPLWYGLHFAHAWMETPLAPGALDALPGPSTLSRSLMDRLVLLAMLPHDPDHPPPAPVRLARLAMLARYHLQRMPPSMLVPHLARKAALRLRGRFTRTPAQKTESQP